MRPSDRATVLIYAIVLGAILLTIAAAGRDVLFERFTARTAPLVVSDGEQVYAVGGRSQSGELYNEVLLVDVTARRIRRSLKVDSLPRGVGGALLDGRLYLLGGSTDGQYESAVLEFNPEQKATTPVGTLPYPVAYGAATATTDRVIFVGGFDGTRRRDEIVAFDPTSGTSKVIGRLPAPRDNLCAAAVGETLFVYGGDGPDNTTATNLLEIDLVSGEVVRSWTIPQTLGATSMVIHEGTVVVLGAVSNSRAALVTLDLAKRDTQSPGLYPVDVDGRSSNIASSPTGLIAVGGAHAIRHRQLAVRVVSPESREPLEIDMQSRVWY